MSQAKQFWFSLLLVFGAQRLADLLNAYTGLWVIPSKLPQETLGAVMPLMSFGAFLALPVTIFATVFTRQLCTYATLGDGPKVRGLLRDAFSATVLTFLAALLIATVCLPWMCDALRIEARLAGYCAVVCGLLAAITPIFTAALQALRRFKAIALSGLLAAPTRLLVMLIALPTLGLVGYFLGQMALLAVTIAVACLALRSLLFGKGGDNAWREDARRMAWYAAKVTLASVIAFLPAFLSSLLIRTRLPDLDSGAFYLISRFSEIATYCGVTVTLVLFPFAAGAQAKGESSSPLRNGSMFAILFGGLLLATGFWFALPWLFTHIPGYTDYVPYAHLAAYLTFITTCNLAAATHYTHAQARDDFRYLRYFIPLSLATMAALWLFVDGTLLRVLHLLFVCALAQLVCVGADLILTKTRTRHD